MILNLESKEINFFERGTTGVAMELGLYKVTKSLVKKNTEDI
jgi:hypothetical protein